MIERVKVASIVVVFPGGERKELTLDEAQALHQQLAELFGITPTVVQIPTYIYRDRWPRIIDTGPTTATPLPARPAVWCKSEAVTVAHITLRSADRDTGE